MKRIVLFLVMVTMAVSASAARYRVTGRVQNKETGETLEMAAVRLFAVDGKDSTMVTGAQTNAAGVYTIDAEPGVYSVVVSMLGYEEKSVRVTVKDQDVSLRPFQMHETTQVLGTIEVQGKAAEMVVRGDTLEYNTAAYKMGENANVEDMLKKMTGVQVDNEGNVTVNGETIKGVRIDGKKFFGNDVQAATKNIPAEMIEKIQVIDEKSDMAKITGIEDEDSERIINLTLKKNRKKGVFGNYSAGIGADMVGDGEEKLFHYNYQGTAAEKAAQFFREDFRYNGNIFTNLMLGESQTTIIGSAGNTNEIRTGRGRGGWGGQNNEGITRAENIGVNTNVDLTEKLKDAKAGASLLFGGDASLTHSINDAKSETDKTMYSQETTFHNLDTTSQLGKTWDASMRLELEYKPNEADKLLIKPNVSYTNSESDSRNGYLYTRNDSVIQMGMQEKWSLNEDIKASLQMIYSHNFDKPGRVLSMDAQVGMTDSKGRSTTDAVALRSIDDVNQKVKSSSSNVNYSLKVSWMEPIYGRNHFLETALTFKGNHRGSEKYQERLDTVAGSLTEGQYIYDADYSNHMQNDYFQEILSLNYRMVKEKLDLTVGAQFNPSQTHSKSYYGDVLSRDTTIYAWNWSPNASIKYKFAKRDFMRLRYRGSSSQPSVTQMEPVRNNSNAMYESVGNLGLKPSFQHQLFWMYSRYNEKRMSNIMTGIRGNLTQDALVNNTIYDRTGKQYSQTVNAESIPWSISGDVMYNTPFANKLMQFHTRTNLGYNQRVGYILRDADAAKIEEAIAADKMQLGDVSRTGNLSAGEDLTLRLTHKIVDVGVTANVNYSRTENSLNKVVNHTVNWGVRGDLELHLPKNWNISTDCGYTARYGYQLKDVNEIIWNASIDKTIGAATLALKVNDILHQKKNIVQTITADAVTYRKYNTLPTYFMFSFTYKLNKMGDLKAKGAAGYMQEMIETGGKPTGMPPMGPPPGR